MPNNAVRSKIKLVRKKKKFNSCSEAVEFLNSGKDVGEADVRIEPKLSGFSVEGGGTWYTASVKYSWTIYSTFTLPKWTWSNMTKADKQAYKRFVDKLQIHEEGHLEVARRILDMHQGEETGGGNTVSNAKANLQLRLNHLRDVAQRMLDQFTHYYDVVTVHGIKQSGGPHGFNADGKPFPGGEDVRLDCP